MSTSHAKLGKICAKNPTSILFARLADGFLRQGKVKQAVEICRRGLRYRPSYVTGHLVMGNCHLAVGRLEEALMEDGPDADECRRRVIALHFQLLSSTTEYS